ncbi:hypothetical protein A2W78_03890 [Candidatus Nomurabacteria bacterium RIFCSPLOWO2_12_40_14]|nr:MAG: hypothetical protein A2W50_00120 [Candidatus Nomurabacteria bacterium RIFCSPHIGHO2_02_40_30]OGI82355.1 MAG: hypothetical protein A3E33_03260 [Candidatus Nomurabacteria bacterium RIFCSPHIGHO2_12_FULL_40_77]OGI98947.1 MAG: hypothetical protein A2W78_03890 [Candidatus Nomurabacteria bacterium RIFCSPLOWO2_12_40_14]HBA45853.1 type II toxin-antitoxin system HicB family antitoxin [Candidatus Nomurabacteria bacterium]HBG68944.1 type II toxin-antitoxin system HicB family antitoxin [Candidatus No
MKELKGKNLIFSIIIEKDSDGYFAECRELQGCYTQGYTYEEVMKNIKEAIELHVKDRIERSDFVVPISNQNQISLTTFSLDIPYHVA